MITERFKALFPNVYGQRGDLEPNAEAPPLDLYASFAPVPTPQGNRRQRRRSAAKPDRAG